MKALTLTQPWADLVVKGFKTIEVRVWNTNFRGRFFVHASKVEDAAECKRYPEISSGINGAILGSVELYDVVTYNSREEFLADQELHRAPGYWDLHASGERYGFNYSKNLLYGFKLRNPWTMLPVLAKGHLKFWEAGK